MPVRFPDNRHNNMRPGGVGSGSGDDLDNDLHPNDSHYVSGAPKRPTIATFGWTGLLKWMPVFGTVMQVVDSLRWPHLVC